MVVYMWFGLIKIVPTEILKSYLEASMDSGEHFRRKKISRSDYNISSSSPQMSATEEW